MNSSQTGTSIRNSVMSFERVLRVTVITFLSATIISILLLASTSCGTALRISHRPVASTANPVAVPGVPFFAKKARCRQEVVWFEPIYTLALTALVPDKDGALQSHARGAVVISRSSFESQEVVDFMKLINNQPSDETTVLTNWKKIATHANSKVLSRDFASVEPGDRILIGRSAAPATYVDYAEQYYVNAKVPVAGSANVDAKVAEDGSLTEASAQTETKTLETILGALPVSSVITGGLGLGGKGVAEPGKAEAFQLSVTVSGYRHTLAHFVDYPAGPSVLPCKVANDIPISEAAEYKREDVSAPSDAKNSSNDDQAKKTKSDTKK